MLARQINTIDKTRQEKTRVQTDTSLTKYNRPERIKKSRAPRLTLAESIAKVNLDKRDVISS